MMYTGCSEDKNIDAIDWIMVARRFANEESNVSFESNHSWEESGIYAKQEEKSVQNHLPV